MFIIDKRTELSLPYFVYKIKIVKDINPKMRKSHAKMYNDNEGIFGI